MDPNAKQYLNPGIDKLCEYCSQIDFDLLDHPSKSEFLQFLKDGKACRRSLTRKVGSRAFTNWGWSLGLQSRIDECSSSCSLCYAIFEVLRQQPHVRDYWNSDKTPQSPVCLIGIGQSGRARPANGTKRESMDLKRISLYWQREDEKNIGPGIVEGVSNDSDEPRLIDCFQACTPGVSSRLPFDGVFDDDMISPQELVFGGRLRPEFIEPELPARWLAGCLENHSAECSSSPSPTGDTSSNHEYETVESLYLKPLTISSSYIGVFRLVDVKDKSIREFHNVRLSSLRYTALSYVWGGTQKMTLRTERLPAMKLSGSLEIEPAPPTIRDAISFTASLNLPYIWVDAICIIQDDEEDKDIQISNMSNVYRHALLTIAAGTGENMNAGLPGVSAPRTSRQVEVRLPHSDNCAQKSLLTTLTPRPEIYVPVTDQCVWSTRGWTLQELALSRRVLIFLDQQIIWLCAGCRKMEETHSGSQAAQISWAAFQDVKMLDTFDGTRDLWGVFEVMIQNFKLRTLGDPGDAHDAFSGILSEIGRRTGEIFLWGMPTSTFELCLCWLPYGPYAPARRTCLTSRKVTSLKRRVPFPSWSWLGWGGHHNAIRYGKDSYTASISCFVFRNSPPRLEPVSMADTPNRRLPLSLDDVTSSHPSLNISKLQDVPDDQYLCFWAERISFETTETIEVGVVKGVPPGTRFFLSSGTHFMVSELLPDSLEDYVPTHLLGPQPKRVRRAIIDAETHNVAGYIEPSRWREETANVELVLMAHEKNKSEYAVVLEVTQEQGVSRRLSIGQVKKQLWGKSDAKTELIVLS